jgi:hypothetical protein
MRSNILVQLLEDAGLDHTKVRVHGQEVVFYDKDLGVNKPLDAPNESPYDTPENRAIVADVIANYDTLAAEYEAKQVIVSKRNAYKTEADPLYAEWQALLAIDHEDADLRHKEWLAKREEIKARF